MQVKVQVMSKVWMRDLLWEKTVVPHWEGTIPPWSMLSTVSRTPNRNNLKRFGHWEEVQSARLFIKRDLQV